MNKYLITVLNVVGDDHSSGDIVLEVLTIEAKNADKALDKAIDLESAMGLKHGQEVICSVSLVGP